MDGRCGGISYRQVQRDRTVAACGIEGVMGRGVNRCGVFGAVPCVAVALVGHGVATSVGVHSQNHRHHAIATKWVCREHPLVSTAGG